MAIATIRLRGILNSLSAVALLTLPVLADPLLKTSYLPDGISSACASALTADTACPQAIRTLQAGDYQSESRLQSLCTDDCASSLATYHSAVLSNCASDTWEGLEDEIQPVAFISEIIRYHYNFTCLSDGLRFCNNVAAAFAAAADTDAAGDPSKLPAGGDFGDHDTSDLCDSCLIKNLAFKAGSPFYDGPELQSQSIYESKTASCGITNAPLTTTANSIIPSVTEAPPTTTTCAGKTYVIQPNDDCFSISVSQSIGTEWLLQDNNLFAFCHEFPTEGNLCLVNTCDVYTVLESDTCKTITKQFGINDAQLRAWNPSINAGCYNLDKMIGAQLCVSKPGTPYVEPEPTTLAPSIPTTAAPLPTNVAVDTNDHCGKFYEVRLGDYCNLLTVKFSISLNDFRFLNPAINENCTNLYAEESYCVQAVGDINTYPGRPGATSYVLSATSGMEDSVTTMPDATWTAPTPTKTPAPLASGTLRDCASYFLGDDWQLDVTDTDYISRCQLIAEIWGVALEDLGIWNPSLGDVSAAGCTFNSGVRYCGRSHVDGNYEQPGGLTEPLFPSREGEDEDCTGWVSVGDGGTPTCQDILAKYGLTIAQFYDMNPSVGEDCSGMWAGYFYCIQTPEHQGSGGDATTAVPSGSTTASATATAGPTPPAPTLDGQPSNCNKWHVVAAGDNCGVIESEYSLTHSQFLEWNPAVSEDCLTGFWGTYAYCVGISGGGGAITTAPPATTTSAAPAEPTNGPVAVPEPNQANNAIASCNKYGQAQSGDWCSAFADRYGLAYSDFYAWNTVLGAGGENCGGSFWATYWYCIGVVA
ncbi:LysM domain-containing protein [Colletotrichum graminicola]|uniref:LysM domain-containing protein n=1 Tax=Colletotrichum graminicola (strain M1.001 / M2 / FGSC 10212) TaxID=645133 RepID=E3QNN8_COLGM|nr:LysM domain-containing protein [Colletotrichum graminicola M1.001]EFQ32525.1 LysM domain-containing protein [Colletotrichum graminicola M1.001]WDK14680.1 LysM domain-containing protein [Colletotrichum graminicola]